jgi:hypothetical protein
LVSNGWQVWRIHPIRPSQNDFGSGSFGFHLDDARFAGRKTRD